MSIPQLLMAALFVWPSGPPRQPTTTDVMDARAEAGLQDAADRLPADPFQRTASKALRGEFGALAGWQEAGYRAGIAQASAADKGVWLTAYYGTEPDGVLDRRGRRCSMRTASANLVSEGSWVWTRYGLRQVLDRGSRRNDDLARRPWRYSSHAHRAPAECWLDYWYARPEQSPYGGSTRQPVACAVIAGGGGR